MIKKLKNNISNIILPIFVFGSITGALTGITVSIYKFCAKHIIHISEVSYSFIRGNLYLLFIIVPLLFGIALLLNLIYKKYPELKGGGIPSSIGILRGILTFKWLRNLIGTFVLSLLSFLIGVPLGNEGPSVQIGTSIGRASLLLAGKKNAAFDRYLLTGGACSGFSAATGASISGIMFAIEEAHQRISPMIILISSVSVVSCRFTSELLAPIFHIETSIFSQFNINSLSLNEFWIPIVIGLMVGLIAVVFLNYFKLINNTLKKIKNCYKILFILVSTVILGLISNSFISTGHELTVELFDGNYTIYFLVLILLIRSTLTLFSNSSGLTGGIFLPIIAIGATFSAILGKILILLGTDQQYYITILVLGITACISGMMKMPITAIVFAVEALSCQQNILSVITVSAITFIITEIFDAKSINDIVLESRIEQQNSNKTPLLIDTFVTIKKGSFAIGKQVRDIFWPANLFVLSINRNNGDAKVDEHGSKALAESDILHIRYLTYNKENTKNEIIAITGDKDFEEKITNEI